MLITIFTPTYNRAYIITNLYKSLERQCCYDFEWVIVDDGSTDNTQDLIKSLQIIAPFKIKYIKQENKGKHIAINKGINIAEGELFFIVDSDDFLSDNAIEQIKYHYSLIENQQHYCGICGMRAYPSGSRIGGDVSFDEINCSSFDYWFKYNIKGDSAEILKTNILKKFPFPEIPNEKFCPEALIWYRLARAGYLMHYFNSKIYICDYLPDGLSAKITRLRINSPIGAMLTYKELYEAKINFKCTVKSAINYWRFYYHCSNSNRIKWRPSYVFSIIGWMFYSCDKVKYKL